LSCVEVEKLTDKQACKVLHCKLVYQ